ncbi:MAG: TMEM14 family protein [Rhabdochlamydiaceae bacterium]
MFSLNSLPQKEARQLSILNMIYAFILLIGGIMGFIKAKSSPSLIFASLFFLMFCFTSLKIYQNKLYALKLNIFLILILDAFFTYRYLLSFKWMPAGLMSALSLILLILFISILRKRSHE